MNEFNPEDYYKTNFIIWVSIILGMILLIGITYFLDVNNLFEPLDNPIGVKNVLFVLILISALAILLLKRSFFNFTNIFNKIKNKQESEIHSAFFKKQRTNYIIIWALSESIIILGFIEYVLLTDFKSFMLYAAVGLYAIVINYPKKSIFNKHLELLSEKQGYTNK